MAKWSDVRSLNSIFTGTIPVGSIVAISSHIANTWAPPVSGQVKDGFMLCDSGVVPADQVIPQGTTLPNLSDNVFLRGAINSSSTSGGSDTDSFSLTSANIPRHCHNVNHTHSYTHNTFTNAGENVSTTVAAHDHFKSCIGVMMYGNVGSYTGRTMQALNDLAISGFSNTTSCTALSGAHCHNMSHYHNSSVAANSLNSGNYGQLAPAAIIINTVPKYVPVIYLMRVS